jgi:o-succinylbenzoate synthase
MKLRELQLRPFRLTLRTPLQRAGSGHRERNGLLVTLIDDESQVGYGEATPLVEFGTEDLAATTSLLNELVHKLAGRPLPSTGEDVEELLARLPELTDAPAARCGLESALLDLAAQRAGLPLAKFLSASARASIPVSALLSASEPEDLAREALVSMRDGFRVVKVKVAARILSDDAKRLIAVRRAVGDEVKIRIDANGAWTESEAATALRGLSPLKLELCEQPVPAANHAALRRLRWQVRCPIAADESVSLPGARDLLLDGEDGPVADVVVLKPMVLGGLLPSLRLARRADVLGVGYYVTSSLDGVVARLGAAHLAAAVPKADWASGLAVGQLFEKDTGPDPCPPRQGEIQLPLQPGLGLAANWSRA